MPSALFNHNSYRFARGKLRGVKLSYYLETLNIMRNDIIVHTFENIVIQQRQTDGYLNATAMCKACGKLFADYYRLSSTKEFLTELSRSMGIPIDLLVQSITTGPNESRGTWVEPHVSIHLAQWLSPKFAVQVSFWIIDWFRTGVNPVQPEKVPVEAATLQPMMSLEASLLWITMQSLRLSEASKVRLIASFGKKHHLDTSFLPEYTEERLTKSLTEQLKTHGSTLSAIKANQVLLALGIIEEQSRPSSKGGQKLFKVLTEEGLKYGKNLISAENERETQPHYYTDTFPELLDKMTEWLKQSH